jgi:hypothetical protein
MRTTGAIGAIVAIWAVAVTVALVLAANTAVGPVVLVVSRQRAQGIDLGDLAEAAVPGAWALLLSYLVLQWARRRPL